MNILCPTLISALMLLTSGGGGGGAAPVGEQTAESGDVAIEQCLFPAGIHASDAGFSSQVGIGAIPDVGGPSADGHTDGDKHRIVLRFIIIRRADGSGGFDESLLSYYMRDLNYGFRDTPFVFVYDPQIEYLDHDSWYEDIPDYQTAKRILQNFAKPGVMNHVLAPSLMGGPPITGLNFPWNPRGNVLAYERIGQPHSIPYPPHEVGHVFWLFHPYEGQFGAECTSGSNCQTAGDLVCDTPASPVVHGGNTKATGQFFAKIPGPCEGDPLYAPRTNLYMEAGWPAGNILKDSFSAGEVERMLSVLDQFSSDLIGPDRPDVLVDCDGNGLDDVEEILAGLKPDYNRDMVPDGCQIFPRTGDLLVGGMTGDTRNRVRIFDRKTGDYRETMWNAMTWVHNLRKGPDGLVYLVRLTIVQRLDLRSGRTVDNFIDGVLEGARVFVDLLFEPDGNILVLDNNTANIRRYNGKNGAYMGVFSNLRTAGMNSPKFMEFGPEGDIFVAGNGSAGATIQRIDHATGQALGSFIKPGAGGLSAAQGLLFHTDGLLYVSDGRSHNVLRYDGQSGEFVDEFVGPGSGGLSNPNSLRFGPDGNLYIASRNTDSVKRYDGQTGDSLGDFVAAGTDGMDQPTGLLFAEVCTPCDANCDGSVDLTDVEPFINLLLNGGESCGACVGDVNCDGSVDLTDVEGFIGCLLG